MSYPPGPPTPPPGEGDPYGYGQPAGAAPTSEERNWALAAHVGSLVAAWFALAFLAPLIVLLVKGKDSAFVRRHAVESLNFQLSMLIYLGIAFVLALVTLGIGLVVIVPVAIVVGIVYLVVVILATIKASNGEDYRYPLTIRMVS
jgi:uncharacterized Tic20 family protein